jgi:ZIP family zinc transporter
VVARFPKLTEPRWLGLIMAFGAGALISAVTTDLVVEAYHEAGRAPTGVGLFGGAVGYYALARWLDRRAERADRGARCRAARRARGGCRLRGRRVPLDVDRGVTDAAAAAPSSSGRRRPCTAHDSCAAPDCLRIP